MQISELISECWNVGLCTGPTILQPAVSDRLYPYADFLTRETLDTELAL